MRQIHAPSDCNFWDVLRKCLNRVTMNRREKFCESGTARHLVAVRNLMLPGHRGHQAALINLGF
jgi:hypothetical protein